MIAHYLARNAEANPDRTFLASRSGSYSYAHATKTAIFLAHALNETSSTRFLIYMRDCPELVLLLIAASSVGAQTCVANRRYSKAEMKALCERFDFSDIVSDEPVDIEGVQCHLISELLLVDNARW